MPRILSLNKYFASNYTFLLRKKYIIEYEYEYEYVMILASQLMPVHKIRFNYGFDCIATTMNYCIEIFDHLITEWISANTKGSMIVLEFVF